MRLIAVESVVVDEGRQRKRFEKIEILAASIQEQTPMLPETQGLIHPIVVRNGNQLVVGERRLRAIKHLGRKVVAAQDIESLGDRDAKVIELEENLKRLDVTWQEETLAIEEIHNLYSMENPGEWTQQATGKRLGISSQAVSNKLKVASAMRANPDIGKANSFATAMGLCMRAEDRDLDDMVTDITHAVVFGNSAKQKVPTKVEPKLMAALAGAGALPLLSNLNAEAKAASGSLLEAIDSMFEGGFEVKVEVPPPSAAPVILPAKESLKLGDFREFVRTYDGPPFNFIHCDFPYGASAAKADSQINVGGDHQTYEDTPEIFWELCHSLMDGMSNVVAASAHIMLWYQSARFAEVWDFLRGYEDIFDLTVFPIPLIWHKSDGSGVVPDPARRPRHIYETALVLSRGDRKVTKTVSDCYACPISRHIHPAEKPQPMLQHFFGMFVGLGTRLLDPTAGSGTALRAGEALGAAEVFGIEQDEKFHSEALIELDSFRRKHYLDKQLQSLAQEQGAKK